MKRYIASSKCNYQVKADGFRTRTYSFSNMGFDNGVSYACYLIEVENAKNVQFIENRPNGVVVVTSDPDEIMSMM